MIPEPTLAVMCKLQHFVETFRVEWKFNATQTFQPNQLIAKLIPLKWGERIVLWYAESDPRQRKLNTPFRMQISLFRKGNASEYVWQYYENRNKFQSYPKLLRKYSIQSSGIKGISAFTVYSDRWVETRNWEIFHLFIYLF